MDLSVPLGVAAARRWGYVARLKPDERARGDGVRWRVVCGQGG